LDLLDKTETKFLEINDSNFNSDVLGMDVLIRNTINEIEKSQISTEDASGLLTGFRDLDNKIGGFQKGTLIILAARPAMGKTALAISMARNMAVDFNKAVAIFSLEMTAGELTSRLISAETSVNGRRFKSKGKLEEWEKTMIREKTQALVKAPIYIDDNPNLTIFELLVTFAATKNNKSNNIMSFLTDLIKEKASEVLAEKISIPEGIQEQVLGGVADSIFGRVKETAGKEGGIDQLIELFTGREKASSSPVAQLASSIFSSNIAKKLSLSPAIVNAIVPMIPVIIEKFTSSKKIDINDLIAEATAAGVTDKLKDAAGSFLGGFFK
jgi:replicative DNA helicase